MFCAGHCVACYIAEKNRCADRDSDDQIQGKLQETTNQNGKNSCGYADDESEEKTFDAQRQEGFIPAANFIAFYIVKQVNRYGGGSDRGAEDSPHQEEYGPLLIGKGVWMPRSD